MVYVSVVKTEERLKRKSEEGKKKEKQQGGDGERQINMVVVVRGAVGKSLEKCEREEEGKKKKKHTHTQQKK